MRFDNIGKIRYLTDSEMSFSVDNVKRDTGKRLYPFF